MGVVDVPSKAVLDLAEPDPGSDPVAVILDRLEARLLAIGGTRLVRHPPNSVVEDVLARGKVFDLPVRLKRGEPNECHANSADLWGRDIETRQLVTGYGLSADGPWREHSWVLEGDRIIETTEKRDIYCGAVLSSHEAFHFWWWTFLMRRYPGPMSLLLEVSKSIPAEDRCARGTA